MGAVEAKDVKIVQIVLEVDGQLTQIRIPQDREALLLHVIQGVFDNGVLPLVCLPEGCAIVPLKNLYN